MKKFILSVGVWADTEEEAFEKLSQELEFGKEAAGVFRIREARP